MIRNVAKAHKNWHQNVWENRLPRKTFVFNSSVPPFQGEKAIVVVDFNQSNFTENGGIIH